METAMIQEPEFEKIQATDPRESKLRDIVERGKASLHKALQEIGRLGLAATTTSTIQMVSKNSILS
jgi:hypothetical protein